MIQWVATYDIVDCSQMIHTFDLVHTNVNVDCSEIIYDVHASQIAYT